MRSPLLASMLGLFLFGCGDSPCDPEVAQSLAERCGIRLGVVAGAFCAPLTSDQNDTTQLQQEICEIDEPDVDVDCLLNESCEDIQMGACSNASQAAQAPSGCQSACVQQAFDCDFNCGDGATSFRQCSDCAIACEERLLDCIDDCD